MSRRDSMNRNSVIQILSSFINDCLTSTETSHNMVNNGEIVELLSENVYAIWNNTSYGFETRDTLDLDVGNEENIEN